MIPPPPIPTPFPHPALFRSPVRERLGLRALEPAADSTQLQQPVRLHAAAGAGDPRPERGVPVQLYAAAVPGAPHSRSEEHTSELQSQSNLVCRLLLEKKNKR